MGFLRVDCFERAPDADEGAPSNERHSERMFCFERAPMSSVSRSSVSSVTAPSRRYGPVPKYVSEWHDRDLAALPANDCSSPRKQTNVQCRTVAGAGSVTGKRYAIIAWCVTAMPDGIPFLAAKRGDAVSSICPTGPDGTHADRRAADLVRI